MNPVRLLLTSLGILLAGHGLQLSLLPLHMRALGWSEQAIGITGAAYFSGFVLGCLTVPALLNRAGSIRVIICLSGLAAAVLLVLEMTSNVYIWSFLRFITGWSLAAIYATTEGWLSDHVEDQRRGRMLSVYVVVTLVGIAVGQVLLGILPVELLFRVGALLMLLAIIPVGLFCADSPIHTTAMKIAPAMLRRVPPLALQGVFLGGIVTGCLWTLAPLIGESRGFSYVEIGLMMNALILGGAICQIPLGVASDRFNRTHTMTITCALSLVGCAVIPLIKHDQVLTFTIAMFVFGGSTLTIYALSAAIGQQETRLSRLETASVLLLLNGLGSIIGPVLAGYISTFTSRGIYLVCAVALALLVYCCLRTRNSESADVIVLNRSRSGEQTIRRAA